MGRVHRDAVRGGAENSSSGTNRARINRHAGHPTQGVESRPPASNPERQPPCNRPQHKPPQRIRLTPVPNGSLVFNVEGSSFERSAIGRPESISRPERLVTHIRNQGDRMPKLRPQFTGSFRRPFKDTFAKVDGRAISRSSNSKSCHR